MIPRFLRQVRRALNWHRRGLAAAAAGLAVFAIVAAIGVERDPRAPALVAVRELRAGQEVTGADVAVVRLPESALPEGALREPGQAVGRTLAGAAPKGGVLSSLSLVSGRLVAGAPGRAIVPVRLSDEGLGSVVSPGDRLTLISASRVAGSPARVVAEDAVVIAVPAERSGGWGVAEKGGALLLVEVDAGSVTAIVQAGGALAIAYA